MLTVNERLKTKTQYVCFLMLLSAILSLPQAGISILLVGLDVSCTAINLSQRDFSYVARSYIITLLFIAAYFATSRHLGWGLRGVWGGLAAFFGVRAMQSSVRAAWALGVLPAGMQKVFGWQPAPAPSVPSASEPSKQPSTQQAPHDLSQPASTSGSSVPSVSGAAVSGALVGQPVSSSSNMSSGTVQQSNQTEASSTPQSTSAPHQNTNSQQAPSHSASSLQASSVSHTGRLQLQPQSAQHVSPPSPTQAHSVGHRLSNSTHAGELQGSGTTLSSHHLAPTLQDSGQVSTSASLDGGSLSDGEGIDPLRDVSQEDKQQAEAQASVASAPHMP
jgi:hypothetical protein